MTSVKDMGELSVDMLKGLIFASIRKNDMMAMEVDYHPIILV